MKSGVPKYLQSARQNSELVYSPYDPEHFSPLALFRSHNDAVANLITQAGSEGVSRYDIGYRLGINAHSKTGNRKVSDSIRKVLTTFPDQISQYQKMEGRFRVLKYNFFFIYLSFPNFWEF
jgi:hypothetical protein